MEAHASATRRLKPEVKQEFREVIARQIAGKEPDVAKVELFLVWVVGVVENAERYGWFDD